MLQAIWVIIAIVIIGILLTRQASIAVWAISFTLSAALIVQYANPGFFTQVLLCLIILFFLTGAIRPLRRMLLSRYLFQRVSKAMPTMSSTEREALEAGTVSWEGELFTGAPNFSVLRGSPVVNVTQEEQAFMEGPLVVLCRMLDDWDITHNRTDLPPEVWQFIKKNRFLGMIIPKEYGGLGLSATAQMSVLVTLYSRSITA